MLFRSKGSLVYSSFCPAHHGSYTLGALAEEDMSHLFPNPTGGLMGTPGMLGGGGPCPWIGAWPIPCPPHRSNSLEAFANDTSIPNDSAWLVATISLDIPNPAPPRQSPQSVIQLSVLAKRAGSKNLPMHPTPSIGYRPVHGVVLRSFPNGKRCLLGRIPVPVGSLS